MVRKRNRTTTSRRNYRKIYDSDESESSESDLDFESPPSSPPPKRYGLRQRKQPMFCATFDYDEEDELNANNKHSDDEEYNVEVDLFEAKENHVTRNNKSHPRRNSARSSELTISTVEPDLPDDALMGDGLIDFEDVIRADVVVNKQRVDYDNVINKTEIEVEDLEDKSKKHSSPTKEQGRRGRKPKAKTHLNSTHNAAEGSSSSSLRNSHEDEEEDDTNLEVQIDPLNFVQCDSDESNPPKSNGVRSGKNKSIENAVKSMENGSSTTTKSGASPPDEIEKFVPPELDEKEKEVVLSNEYLLGNSFDMSADEFLEKQAQTQNVVVEEEEEAVTLINFDDDSGSDDDVVIIEKKPEIIVLDDD